MSMILRTASVSLAHEASRRLAAQESASFRISESVLNAGGQPEGGVAASSASYRITLGSVGEGLSGAFFTGAGFGGEGGFVAAFPPPGEVGELRFSDAVTLVWAAHPATMRFWKRLQAFVKRRATRVPRSGPVTRSRPGLSAYAFPAAYAQILEGRARAANPL